MYRFPKYKYSWIHLIIIKISTHQRLQWIPNKLHNHRQISQIDFYHSWIFDGWFPNKSYFFATRILESYLSLYVLHNNICVAYDCENTFDEINSISDIDGLPIDKDLCNEWNVYSVFMFLYGFWI